MNYYIVINNERTGPYTEAQIRELLAAGTLTPASLIWWEGLATPVAISACPIFGSTSVGTSALAITSLVLGIISLPAFICTCLSLPFSLGAIITGHIARNNLKSNPNLSGKGMALAGLILGYISIVLACVYFIFVFSLGLNGNVKKVFEQLNAQLEKAKQEAKQEQMALTNTPPADATVTPTPASTDTTTNAAPTQDTTTPTPTDTTMTPASPDTNAASAPDSTTKPAGQ